MSWSMWIDSKWASYRSFLASTFFWLSSCFVKLYAFPIKINERNWNRFEPVVPVETSRINFSLNLLDLSQFEPVRPQLEPLLLVRFVAQVSNKVDTHTFCFFFFLNEILWSHFSNYLIYFAKQIRNSRTNIQVSV